MSRNVSPELSAQAEGIEHGVDEVLENLKDITQRHGLDSNGVASIIFTLAMRMMVGLRTYPGVDRAKLEEAGLLLWQAACGDDTKDGPSSVVLH